MKPIIQVEALSKRYDIVRTGQRAGWLLADVRRGLRRLGGRLKGDRSEPQSNVDHLWALRDVSFTVGAGEVVGLVGANGAGKTTLLKLLSLITEPTSGRAILRGRLNSLLEVGIGFHPELTGRENIFLKGAIHGVPRDVLKRKFDEIVAFAEIERFLDTPMKRYSNGMRSRLGFAIGAFMEHEILVVDEVLAVGDARFRSAAMAYIKKAAQEYGTTTIFVSHDLSQIRELCPRSILLDHGRLVADGESNAVLERYLQPTADDAFPATWEATRDGHLRRLELQSVAGVPAAVFPFGQGFRAQMLIAGLDKHPGADPRIFVESNDGRRLFRFCASHVGLDVNRDGAEAIAVTVEVDTLPLTPGVYWLGFILGSGRGRLERLERVLRFQVRAGDPYGAGATFVPADGSVWVPGRWSASPSAPTLSPGTPGGPR